MKTSRACLITTLLTLAVVRAHADPGTWEFTLAPGYAIPMGDTSDQFKKSASLDGSVFYGVRDGLSIGMELGYVFGMKFEGTVPGSFIGDVDGDGVPDTLNFSSDIHASVLHITPEIKIGPTMEEAGVHIRPCVVAGGGWYRTHFSEGTMDLSGETSSGLTLVGSAQSESLTESNGGWNIGGGIDFSVADHFRLGVDVRYHDIVYKNDTDTTFLIPALRLTYLF